MYRRHVARSWNLGTMSATYQRDARFLLWSLTRLADAEELIGVPRHDTSWQSTPAPFHNATKCLHVLVYMPRSLGAIGRTNGSARRSSCARLSPRNCLVPSYAALKKLRTKLRDALVSEVGRKGRRMKGISTAAACQRCLPWWPGRVVAPYLLTSFLVCKCGPALVSLLERRHHETMHLPIGVAAQQARCWRLLLILTGWHLSI